MIRKWLEQRRQNQEMERDIKVRRAKRRIQRYIEKQRQMEKKLWALGKQAIKISDERQFRQIGKQIIWTQADVERWERYMLNLETLEVRRDQARMTGEFMGSLQAMSESMLAGITPQSMVDIQRNLEEGLARAQNLEERLSLFMEMAEDAFHDVEVGDDMALTDLESNLRSEAEMEAAHEFDAQIAAGLEKIRQEMKNS